jgi:membrane protein
VDVVRTRLLSFGMVLVLAFLLMVSLVVSAALALLENTGAACGATPAWC